MQFPCYKWSLNTAQLPDWYPVQSQRRRLLVTVQSQADTNSSQSLSSVIANLLPVLKPRAPQTQLTDWSGTGAAQSTRLHGPPDFTYFHRFTILLFPPKITTTSLCYNLANIFDHNIYQLSFNNIIDQQKFSESL